MRSPRRASEFPFFDNDGLPLAFAHRGGALLDANTGIENSLKAFAAAVALGYRYLETDVHATADGQVVAFHDATLDRVTDATGLVRDLPWSEVSAARIGGREPIPLLADLLDAWPEVRLNIDCKAPGAIEPLAAVIRRHRAQDRVCVASFSERRIRRLRRALDAEVATSYAAPGVAALRLVPAAGLAHRLASTGSAAVQVPVAAGPLRIVTAAFVRRVHAIGKHVHVWTVDDPDEIARVLDVGVDGVMTDRPDVLRDVLRARGQWPDGST